MIWGNGVGTLVTEIATASYPSSTEQELELDLWRNLWQRKEAVAHHLLAAEFKCLIYTLPSTAMCALLITLIIKCTLVMMLQIKIGKKSYTGVCIKKVMLLHLPHPTKPRGAYAICLCHQE